MKSGLNGIRLHWLEQAASRSGNAGVTWGVPWPKGKLDRKQTLRLATAEGTEAPMQSWPTAYWPDGSVKWTAHAAVVPRSLTGAEIYVGDEPFTPPEQAVTVSETEDEIMVNTGVMRCVVGRSGSKLIREITQEGRRLCTGGTLTAIRETVSEQDGAIIRAETSFESEIHAAAVEQRGPVRAVVKLTGIHRLCGGHPGSEAWLPFTVRLYFYAGQEELSLTHTFIYDGDPHRAAIKGLGLRLAVPLGGPLYNRHVRMAGDTGWFAESPRGLMTFRLTDDIVPLYKAQQEGKTISFGESAEKDAAFLRLLDDSAVWNDFKLTQLSADSYAIRKRTGEGCSWIRALGGRRARGVAYVGSETGGIGLGVRHFWRQYPSGHEIGGTGTEKAVLTAWFWSPEAEAMDLRHYDTRTHVSSSYEGADELRSTPYGVGHTTECVIWCRGGTPSRDDLEEWAARIESPPLLVCEPKHYYDSRTLGSWSLPDRSVPPKAKLEEMLDGLVAFYKHEVDARGWYGFWDYGDFMHSYDPVRHAWKYDIGGCAWQNTELAPNMWLWYMFLRSGRPDIFRMAEAMTRHTSETDLYHLGEYAGLGSRHNILHWGCGCKETRIGMAGLHKFYYYLTADERIGDILDEVKDADYATVNLDPMRAYFPKDEFVTHVRSGPDWAAFCSNWLVQWERYEDVSYRDKMLVGMESLKSVPYRLLTGPTFGYDPATGVLSHMGHENYGHHLMICMGGAQVWMEMAALLGDPEWNEMLAEFGEFYNLPPEEKNRRTSGEFTGKDWNIPMLSTSMMAFASVYYKNPKLAEQAWHYLTGERTHWNINEPITEIAVPTLEYAYPITELPWMSTNTASQWSINTIICLELIGDAWRE